MRPPVVIVMLGAVALLMRIGPPPRGDLRQVRDGRGRRARWVPQS